MEFGWWKFLGNCSCLLFCEDKVLRFFGGKSLVVKALPCEEVEVRKLEVTSISKFLRFYGLEDLSFKGLFTTLESTTRRFISVEES